LGCVDARSLLAWKTSLASLASSGEISFHGNLWIQQKHPTLQPWQDFASKMLGATPSRVDFRSPATLGIITQWFFRHAGPLAKDFVKADDIDGATVVAGAVTKFQGEWPTPYPPAQRGEFTREGKAAVQAYAWPIIIVSSRRELSMDFKLSNYHINPAHSYG
jgi:hypothetical protein